MKQKLFPFFSFFFILLFSCQTIKYKNKFPVYITNKKMINLLPPDKIEETIDTLQLICGKYEGKKFTVQSYTIANEEGISMNLINEMGTDLGSLSYAKNALSFDSSFFPRNMKLQYIIADFQFCYYDSKALKDELHAVGLNLLVTKNLEETNSDDSRFISDEPCNSKAVIEIRKIYDGEKCIECIEKKAGVIRIVNNLRKYEYILQDIENE